MGTWGFGPFDNDTAAVWSTRYEEASIGRRGAMIREALTPAIGDDDAYLDSDFAFEAIAAAAVLAGEVAIPEPAEGIGARRERPWLRLRRGAGRSRPVDGFGRDADLPALAIAALDRIGGDRSEWRSLRQESGTASLEVALGTISRIRGVLKQAGAGYRGRESAEPGVADERDAAGSLKYLTYTKYHPGTGRTFTGRLSGRGDPQQILETYDRDHKLNAQGFGVARLDVWIEATKPYAARHSDRTYQAIRGREHGSIEANGGIDRRP